MRKPFAIILALLVFLVTGCSKAEALLSSVSLSGEELYSKLNYAISSPDNLDSDDLPGIFTFTAMILSEPEEVTFDDDETVYTYQAAGIARNSDDYFLLDCTGLEETFGVEEIVSITGEVDGSVYWTEDNKMVTVLDILPKKVEVLPESTVEVSTDPTVKVNTQYESGIFTFKDAQMSESVASDCVIIYFDFENTGSRDAAPMLEKFYVYKGETLLEDRAINVKNADSSALAANGVGIADKTFSGKTASYYMAFETENAENEDIVIEMYDDDFHLTHSIAVPFR